MSKRKRQRTYRRFPLKLLVGRCRLPKLHELVTGLKAVSATAAAVDISLQGLAAVLQHLKPVPRLSDGAESMDEIGESMKATIAKMQCDAEEE